MKMRSLKFGLLAIVTLMALGCQEVKEEESKDCCENNTAEEKTDSNSAFVEDVIPVDPWEIERLASAPTLDGDVDSLWNQLPWRPMNHVWLGEEMEEGDFEGQFKLGWTTEGLFLLVEVLDDTVVDTHEDPMVSWWNDDCVEVFVDEDRSKGGHQFNHSAFAYHVALDGTVIDLGPDEKPHTYNSHAPSAWKQEGNKTTWEIKVALYDSTFVDGKSATPSVLEADKKIGFMVAYCDNDKSEDRENFIGSNFIAGEDKDQGWKDAGVFREVVLKD